MMDVHQLLAYALDNSATEVMISVGLPPTLRFPDGLRPAPLDPLTPESMEALLHEVLGPDFLARLFHERQLELLWRLRPDAVFRAAVFSERTSWAVAFRLMPSTVPSPETLLLPKELRAAAEDGSGLVLVAAAPGHGRSTTLLSLVDVVNQQRAAHVLTLERRLKILLAPRKSMLFQREIGPDPLAAANALKVACVQDPDVLMITHLHPTMLPDALELAGRGRLVFAGVDAVSAVDALRLLLTRRDDPEATVALQTALALSLHMVIAQRLLPRADQSSWVLATEMLPIRIEEARLLRVGDLKALQAVLLSHPEDGAIGMDRCIQFLYKRNIIDRDCARRHMNDQKLLEA